MSDFISNFWSSYVAVASLLSILGCVLLLWLTARKRVPSDADNTTGHVWDEDLREANNPLPLWWVGLFVLTIVFSLGYLAVFPGLGSFRGTNDWSSRAEYQQDVAKATQALAPVYARYAPMPLEEVARDPQARAIGERLFMNNCAQCHGSDARGSKGFPNLTDADWLHGGMVPMRPLVIDSTILSGVPPCSQSASVRLGKPLLPRASEPWHCAQLFMNRRSPMARACGSRATSSRGMGA